MLRAQRFASAYLRTGVVGRCSPFDSEGVARNCRYSLGVKSECATLKSGVRLPVPAPSCDGQSLDGLASVVEVDRIVPLVSKIGPDSCP